MITSTTNYGKLSEDKRHKLDCRLYEVSEQVYMLDPQPTYMFKENDKGETIVECENGFEQYANAILEVSGV